MSCTSPRCALVPFGGGHVKFLHDDYPNGYHPLGRIVYLPCGGCLACRRERRQDLTVLQVAEASLHVENWFLTLTYEDQAYKHYFGEEVFSLKKKHLQSFCESMRKFCRYHETDFRFFACGEYGHRYMRPHYHMSIFGLSSKLLCISDDKNDSIRQDHLIKYGKLIRLSTPQVDDNGYFYWQSPVIFDRWPYGSHKLYRASRETFQYVAGYVTKKLTGDLGKEFRAAGRESEFSLQSRPSIGYPYFLKFKDNMSLLDGDHLVNDSVDISDLSWRIPRIMDKWRQRLDGDREMQRLKRVRCLFSPRIPDRQDLKRKAEFERYSADRFLNENRSHREVK